MVEVQDELRAIWTGLSAGQRRVLTAVAENREGIYAAGRRHGGSRGGSAKAAVDVLLDTGEIYRDPVGEDRLPRRRPAARRVGGRRKDGAMSRALVYPMRVRFAECDPQGIVFNSRYLEYFDVAMTEIWREAIGPYEQATADNRRRPRRRRGRDPIPRLAAVRRRVRAAGDRRPDRDDVDDDRDRGRPRSVRSSPRASCGTSSWPASGGTTTPIPDAVRTAFEPYVPATRTRHTPDRPDPRSSEAVSDDEAIDPRRRRIYVTGHRNPDTDSIASAIAYAELKQQLDPESEYVPVRLGKVNAQTAWVLERSGCRRPDAMQHVLLRVRRRHAGEPSRSPSTASRCARSAGRWPPTTSTSSRSSAPTGS